MYTVRERCGRQLAVEASVEADIVSTVPDSATPAALGYSQQVDTFTALLCLVYMSISVCFTLWYAAN